MNSHNNLKSGQRTLSRQMLVLAVVIVLIAFIGLFIQKSSTNNIFNSGFKDYQRSAKLLKDVNSVHANLYRIKGMVASSQDKQEIDKISDQQVAIINEDINLAKKTLETNISAEQKQYYQAIMDNLIEYQKSSLQVIRTAPLGTGGAYLVAANEKMEAITQLLSQLLDFESNVGEQGYSKSDLTFYAVCIVLLLLLVLSVFLIPSFVKKMITSSVTEPLQETSGVLREFAHGKYNRSLAWDADDAIGELVQSVNSLRSKMSSPAAAGPTEKTQTHEATPTAKAPTPAAKAPAPKVSTPGTATPAEQAPTREAAAVSAAERTHSSLSDMIKKSPEQTKDTDKLVISSRKAIDKLQDI